MRNINEISHTSEAVVRVIQRHWPETELPDTLAAEVRTAIEVCLSASENPSISPAELANNWGIGVDKVLNWIRNGHLKAINVASTETGRPRYRITEDAISEFQEARRPVPPPKLPRTRRRKPAGDVIEFF
ncbi:MAG: helix-turn-helix domain-containing protein [Planctomycetaceae bacterium]|nr:helix-turn-helix domain-containing protein [Planctomycetaceae bacterium]